MSPERGSAAVPVEPVPGEPVAVATLGSERVLVVADYHAGYEAALRAERGVEVDSRAQSRRDHLLALIDETDPDRVVILGDLMHSIGGPGGAERGEVEVLAESLPEDLAVTLVKGNHDGDIESWAPRIEVTDPGGVRLGGVGLVHGHTWPDPAVLEADAICVGHEHPCVRLEDAVGGSRIERVWLRGSLDPAPFEDRYDDLAWRDPELIVVPAFNELVGGAWINVGDGFLAPFLPDGLADGEAYLLDGTRLGPYRSID